jgi:zinc protease
VTGLACADLERFWREHAVRDRARLSFVGATAVFERSFRARTERSEAPTTEARLAAVQEPPRRPRTIRLLDKPGAPQSEIRIGHEGVARTDADWFPAYALNWLLGGSFSSRINLNLRERRGYTYGARSSFEGGLLPGELTVATAVETRHTAPAVVEIVRELEGMLEGPTPAEVDFVRRALVQSLYRSYESMAGRLAYVENVSKYGYPEDYPVRRRAWLEALEPAELRALAVRRLRPEALVLCVVGDAAAVEPSLRALPGFAVERLDDGGRSLALG